MQRPINKKPWLPAALALGIAVISVVGSACFVMTGKLMDTVNGTTVRETASLRVQHTYFDSKGRLVVLADGGPWQSDRANTPRQPIWFQVNIAKLISTANNGIITLPQSVLRSGSPDPASLTKDGFNEITFYEYRNGSLRSLDGRVIPADGNNVRVAYEQLLRTPNFPEQLGYAPQFTLKQDKPPQTVTVEIFDEHHTGNPVAIILLPVAIVADVVLQPVYFLSISQMKM